MKKDIYENYTSTSVLADVDPAAFTQWSHKYFKHFILPHIPSDKNVSILEIGCGYGRYTGLLTNVLGYKNTVGIDISEEQIEFAKKNYSLTNVYQADALEFLQSNRLNYDVVILMDVLEHLELSYAISVLEKIKSSLTVGGKLIIQVPNGLSPMKPIFYGDVTHIRAFTVNSMSQILRMASFSDFTHLPVPPMVHNIKSFFHRVLWSGLINPLVHLFMLLSHGSAVGGIFSSNLITIAIKR